MKLVKRLLGRDPMKRKRKPGSIIGYVPVRVNQKDESTGYLEIRTNERNASYSGTIAGKLREWLKEGTVRYVGNRDELGSRWMRRNIRSILPFVVEIHKPRLCVDGSVLGTVGPDEKPNCILDTVSDALGVLEKGMLMCKTDDSLVLVKEFYF